MFHTMAEAATAAPRVASEAELLRAPSDGRKRELVDGEIRVSPGGARHGQVAVRLSTRLHVYASERGLGLVFDSSTGFKLPGGNVRSPDVSFVARGRFKNDRPPESFADLAPDLAVEVLSPTDNPRSVLDKVGEYLQAGTRLVWVIDPAQERAAVYRSLTTVRELLPHERLDGEEIVTGFSVTLAELLS